MIPYFGYRNTACWELAEEKREIQSFSPRDGLIVYSTSLKWCTENCSSFITAPIMAITTDFLFLFMAFALPAVIFSTVIPRRWRLDLPEQLFKISRGRIFDMSKLLFSIPAVCVVATFDMVGWIFCIMSHDPDDPTSRIHKVLIPSELPEESLESSKSRLITIMNAQTSFCMTIGILTVFLLGGFLYNVPQASSTGAIPFGILWMVLVVVTMVSGTLLAGNCPHTVSVLMINNYARDRETRRLLLRDMYDSGFCPVSMWDRGLNKNQWLKISTLWQDCQGTFRQEMELCGWSLVVIAMGTFLLLASPCLLAWTFDHLIPWPWFRCLSLLYLIYLVTQTLLIIVALALANLGLATMEFGFNEKLPINFPVNCSDPSHILDWSSKCDSCILDYLWLRLSVYGPF